MNTKISLIIAIFIATLLIPIITGCVDDEKAITKTYWQVEEPRGSSTYYIRWEVTSITDSLQYIYYC